ncbi:MAG: class I tRNA ligase family protein, partial [Armatimonadota bacterium]
NEGIQGQVRFLSRVMRLVSDLSQHFDPDWPMTLTHAEPTDLSRKIRRSTHQLIQKATGDIEKFAFNTYVSACMTTANTLTDLTKNINPTEAEAAAISEAIQCLILVLGPAAPHTADELWEGLGMPGFTYQADWPKADPELAKADMVNIAVQVNGKLRDTLELPAGISQEELVEAALASSKVKVYTDQGTIRKTIVVPGKLVNFVVN